MNERKPSEDVMRELCEAVDGWCGLEGAEAQPQWAPETKRVWSAVTAYRAAKKPRTRADIAVELCSKLGSSAYGWGPGAAARQVTFNLPEGVGPELLDLVAAFANAEDAPPRPATEWVSAPHARPEGIPHTRPEDVPTEPEACGCEEVESLKAQIAALRARNYDLAMQVSHIRKLARAPEVQALFEEIDREP